MSRPHEKFLLEPSRKFLSEREKLGGGTNRNEPKGTRLAALVEAGRIETDYTSESGRADASERTVGEEIISAQKARRGSGGDPWAARRAVEPAVAGPAAEASPRAGAARVPRFWSDADRRISGASTWPGGRQGDGAEMDDQRGAVEAKAGASRASAYLASTAGESGRIGAVGYQRACLAGESRARQDVLGGNDRRRYQYAVRALRGGRHDRTEHAGAVGLFGALRPSASSVHGQGGDVSTDAGAGLEDGGSGREGGNPDWPRV